MNFDYVSNDYKNCEVSTVLQVLPHRREYWIELKIPVEGTCFPKWQTVRICNSDISGDLLKLKKGEVKRCYFSFGMQDIDVYRVGEDSKQYVINWSPVECTHAYFYLKDGEIDKIINAISAGSQGIKTP